MILLRTLPLLLAILLPILAQDSHTYPKQRGRGANLENKMIFKELETKSDNGDIEPFDETYRLSSAYEPASYFVRIQPFVNGNNTVTGYVEIVFGVNEATSVVILQMDDITYDEASVNLQTNDAEATTIDIVEQSYDDVREFYTATLAESLQPGVEYVISLDFIGLINDGLDGLYQSTYIDENGDEIPLAATQFQATHARQSFPCFDEPAFKATFQAEIGREDSHVALTNTPILSSREIDGFTGWTWDLFDVTPVMSSYLVAFVISDFVSVSVNSSTGTLFRTWSRSEIIDNAQYSLDVSPGISTYFEEYYAIPYPISKQDQIAIPDFSAGAMENWGLITYREELLLFDPVFSTVVDKRNIVQVIGHELAHMWTGNLITTEWWSHLWLNEGFASYYEYLGANAEEEDMDLLIDFVYQTLQGVFGPDSNEGSRPVVYEVNTEIEISSMFNTNTYSKGGSLVRMMDNFLTPATFQQGMRNYLNANAYGTAFQDELFQQLTDQAHSDGTLDPSMTVKEIMDTWTLQGGYPLITVTVNGDGTATVTQERYLQVDNEDAIALTYWVPITYASDSINTNYDTFPETSNWMSPADSEITITGLSPTSTWHIFNTQQAMYYRVNYDAATWTGIADHLAADALSVDTRNRAQLLDDSFVLAEKGTISYTTAFDIADYLNNENHYVPWKSFLVNVGYIEEMFSRTTAYTGLREFLQRALNPSYDVVGSVDSPTDPDRTVFLRDTIVPWACDMGYDACAQSAVSQFSAWMATPSDYTIISPNLKSSVYCTAVKESSVPSAEWEFSFNLYQTTESSDEASLMLFAMACSTDQATINLYLDMIFNGEGQIASGDSNQAFNYIAGTDVGRDLAWDYLVNNYHAIATFYGSYVTVQELAADASREFNTAKDLAELNAFRTLLAEETPGNTDEIDNAVIRVENNIAWMATNYETIAGWLTDNGYGTV